MILFEEIRSLLPQKYPFLFIDRVVELEEGKKIVCVKNVSGNEPVFVGHFPDFAIMPGVLIIEAMAQASIILFRKSLPTQQNDKNTVFLLASINNARFTKTCIPRRPTLYRNHRGENCLQGSYCSGNGKS